MADENLIYNGQVYSATHPNDEYNKFFISFSWGEKSIEDFNLLVISSGDRYRKDLYGSFEDTVTESQMIDGQYFWRSKFSFNELNFSLATDGMEESQLQQFKNWFRPGIVRKLILSEKPNMFIYARIKEIPVLNILPFTYKKQIFIGENSYNVDTTLWKGEGEINFIMDDPFWISSVNYYKDEPNQLMLRSIVEEGIPHKDMFDIKEDEKIILPNKIFDGNTQSLINNKFNIDKNNRSTYLYYCGTGVSKPILNFSFQPRWSKINNGEFEDTSIPQSEVITGMEVVSPGNTSIITKYPYIIFPKSNIIKKLEYYKTDDYNYISIGSNKFKFTSPSIITSYNTLVKFLFEDFSAGDSILDLKEAIESNISNIYARMWALTICELGEISQGLDICEVNSGILKAGFNEKFISNFNYMYAVQDPALESSTLPFKCSINSKTGVAQIEYQIYPIDRTSLGSIQFTNFSQIRDVNNPLTIKENIGDMIHSNYLIIDERTLPNNLNKITSTECLPVRADCSLSDVSLQYEYIYV